MQDHQPAPDDRFGGHAPARRKVKSAVRVLQILELFEAEKRPLTLAEIAGALDFPASSALALLRSVEEEGYLTYDSSEKDYFPTYRLVSLGSWLGDSLFHNGAVFDVVDRLMSQTGETVFLGVKAGDAAQYVHVAQSPNMLRYHPPVGTRRPLLGSAIGQAILCQLPDRDVVATVRRMARDAEVAVPAPEEVLRDMAAVRAAGFAFTQNQFTRGASVVAVPLPGQPGRPPMAIGVGGPADRMEPQQAAICSLIQRAIRHLGP